MTFSTRSFIDLSAPLTAMPILAIGAPLSEPAQLSERRACCEPPPAPFLLERRARAPGSAAASSAVCVGQTLDVGLPRKPPPLPPRRQHGGALFEPCAAPRRVLPASGRRRARA